MVGFAAAHTVFFVLLAVLYGQMRRAWLGMRRLRGCELQIAAQRREGFVTVCEGPIGGAKALYGGTRRKC